MLWRKITAVIHFVTFLRVAAPRKHEKNKHNLHKPSGNHDGNKIVFLIVRKKQTIKHNRFLEEVNSMAANEILLYLLKNVYKNIHNVSFSWMLVSFSCLQTLNCYSDGIFSVKVFVLNPKLQEALPHCGSSELYFGFLDTLERVFLFEDRLIGPGLYLLWKETPQAVKRGTPRDIWGLGLCWTLHVSVWACFYSFCLKHSSWLLSEDMTCLFLTRKINSFFFFFFMNNNSEESGRFVFGKCSLFQWTRKKMRFYFS